MTGELEIKLDTINYKIAELQEIIKHKDQEIYNFKHQLAEQQELIEDKKQEIKRLKMLLNTYKKKRKKCSNPKCNNLCWSTSKNSMCSECYKKEKTKGTSLSRRTVQRRYMEKRKDNGGG